MTPRFAALVLALVLLVPVVAGARAAQADQRTPEQRTIDAQLATPKLAAGATVSGLDLTDTPLRDIVGAIAQAGGVTVRYHSALTNLDALSAVKLSNATVEDALRTVLDPKALAFKVTGAKSAFIYPNTPENREKYTESLRTFAIVNADLIALTQTVNRALTVGADDLRATIVISRDSRSIIARATADTMAKIAKVISDNDKR